jgi:hypothetical protein
MQRVTLAIGKPPENENHIERKNGMRKYEKERSTKKKRMVHIR